jgi:hypothetical protein
MSALRNLVAIRQQYLSGIPMSIRTKILPKKNHSNPRELVAYVDME